MNIEKLKTKIPKITNNKNIGILSGSFDPPHICHAMMAVSIFSFEPINELWIIPCANHPFNKKLTAFSGRMSMCKIAFSIFGSKVKILPIENYLPSPNYTIKTMKMIKKFRPNINISLILGSDLLQKIHKWYDFKNLNKFCDIIIFLRKKFPINKVNNKIKINKIYKNYILPDISSSNIRNKIKKLNLTSNINEKLFIDQNVLNFIIKNNIYKTIKN